MKAIRVLIADDHPLFRKGLSVLFRTEPGFVVVGEASDGDEALKLARDLHPDVLLLDVVMPHLTGLEALRELFKSALPVRTILFTAAIEKEQIAQALQFGARGIVMKGSPTQVLLKSIRTVMEGKYWVGEEPVADLMGLLRTLLPAPSKESERPYGLTPRELEIVECIVAGYTNRDIADKFSISEQTVKHHLHSTFDKTGVSNRLELALFAINHNLVSNV